MAQNKEDHLNLLCDLGDLAALFTGSQDIESFLQLTVELVARHLKADVCSIYLYDISTKELVLQSTIGLNPSAVRNIRMKPGEGLVGNTFEQMKPVREAYASTNPMFKYFKEADEDRFESFLAVPIQRGVQKIGVLVVQHEKHDYFTATDVMALRASASQLASAVENARLLIDLYQMSEKNHENQAAESLNFIKGESASGGYAFAASAIFKKSHGRLISDPYDLNKTYTINDFYKAVKRTSEQLMDLQSRLAQRLPESASLIFSAHFLILKDPKYINKIAEQIKEGVSPPDAVRSVTKHYIEIFSFSPHAYIREKASDMEDLGGRILKNIFRTGLEESFLSEHRIVIAGELYPSEILKMASEDVKGIILVKGGITSHVSILARSMQIPLVIADRAELLNLPEDTPILLDAEIGNIYVNPSEAIINQFEEQRKVRETTAGLAEMNPETRTKDGVRVHLFANINLLSELSTARDLKAEGIGLYRTEFPFLIRSAFPSEEEQYLIFKRLFDEMAGLEVTIRTLDVGGDKALAYADATSGANPQMGFRSIRFCLHHRSIFEQHIRAILRAAADFEKLRIMFPLISSLDEFLEARQSVKDCITALEHENLAHHLKPEIGMMIEVPSVVEIMDGFARESDFFSVGTNDFVQYTLAVDRTNEKVADYYRPYHPSVLRGLARIVKSANDNCKDISICGEMAHEPEYIPFLIGIGVRAISVDPRFLPLVQKIISSLSITQAAKHAGELLSVETLKDARNLIQAGII
ncbi:Putative phosphoenolpyruvate-protein phosphotransferase, PtsI-like [Desulfonema limicola]|uniref:phosphoenolpyruvate--protein phosphotransferase n=1 Tax=Desulfonema limicola TaxID=45656 RepID=A0A975BEA8_9BACT|nr:phosphoenolpyruvate--protein phosphotransferase [Desulfonema limicola]QTA83705.1 Putative phosphoenolpyruvate-protein phosphotransferase, PtsI-like [Desulfonema limicola]